MASNNGLIANNPTASTATELDINWEEVLWRGTCDKCKAEYDALDSAHIYLCGVCVILFPDEVPACEDPVAEQATAAGAVVASETPQQSSVKLSNPREAPSSCSPFPTPAPIVAATNALKQITHEMPRQTGAVPDKPHQIPSSRSPFPRATPTPANATTFASEMARQLKATHNKPVETPSLSSPFRKPAVPAPAQTADQGTPTKPKEPEKICPCNRKFRPNRNNNGVHCTYCCNAQAALGNNLFTKAGAKTSSKAFKLIEEHKKKQMDEGQSQLITPNTTPRPQTTAPAISTPPSASSYAVVQQIQGQGQVRSQFTTTNMTPRPQTTLPAISTPTSVSPYIVSQQGQNRIQSRLTAANMIPRPQTTAPVTSTPASASSYAAPQQGQSQLTTTTMTPRPQITAPATNTPASASSYTASPATPMMNQQLQPGFAPRKRALSEMDGGYQMAEKEQATKRTRLDNDVFLGWKGNETFDL